MASEGYSSRRFFDNYSPKQIREELERNPSLQEELGPELVAELTGRSRGDVHSLQSTNHDAWYRYRAAKSARTKVAKGTSIIMVSVVVMIFVIWGLSRVVKAEIEPLPSGRVHPILELLLLGGLIFVGFSGIVLITLPHFGPAGNILIVGIALTVVALIGYAVAGLGRSAAFAQNKRPQSRWLISVLIVFVAVCLIVSIMLPSLNRARELAKRAMLSSDLRSVAMGRMIPAMEISLPSPSETTVDKTSKLQTRIRSYFPETLLWRPQLITDPDGYAELSLPLADSITTWRLGDPSLPAVFCGNRRAPTTHAWR